MQIRKNDLVKVMSGKDKGKTGKVLEVLREKARVRIEKVAVVKRHLKKGRSQSNPEGGIIERNGSIAISSVMALGQGDKPVRKEKMTRELGAKEKKRREKKAAAK
jgi:large subunit ribosomal protein L24